MSARAGTALDDSVFPSARSLTEDGVESPLALFLLGTGLGVGTLPGHIWNTRSVPLEALAGAPECWRHAELLTGRLEGAPVWVLADAPGGHEFGEDRAGSEPGWARAWPVWLARAAGAEVCVHTSAGVRVGPPEQGPRLGGLALLRDHLNLSGRNPLVGLGETRLGPLFPDQSRLHHGALREHALERARLAGIPASPAVAACTVGPALDTPAELGFYARAGAQVAVQGLADPLIACSHAGLAVLAIVAVTDDGRRPVDLARMLELADAIAPGLEELLVTLGPEVAAVARALREAGA